MNSDPTGPERPAPPDDEPVAQPLGDAPLEAEELAPYESPAAARARQRMDSRAHPDAPNMLPGRERRRTGIERLFVRLVATGGIVAIGVAIAAIMVSSKSQGWIVGLVVSVVTVVLAAILWSSRQL